MSLRERCAKEFIKEGGKFNHNRSRLKELKLLVGEIVLNTQFLPEGSPISQRIWHILNDLCEPKKCLGGNTLKFISYKQGYSIHCSDRRCRCYENLISESSNRLKEIAKKNKGVRRSPETIKRMKETNVKKYGSECTLASPQVKEKIKTTMKERYGVENALESDELRGRMKETMKERYGVENAAHSEEMQDKRKNTLLKKYGTTVTFASDDVKDKVRQSMLKSHGVRYSLESPELRKKFSMTMKERYGHEHSNQIKHIKERIRHTLLSNYYGDANWEKLRNSEWWDSFDDFRTLFSELLKMMVKETAMKYIKEKRPDLYPDFSTIPEKIVQEYLKKNGISFIANDRKTIPPLELDVVIPSKKLAIEINGVYWHSEISGNKDKRYHQNKFNLCKEQGIQLMQFTDIEVLQKTDIVLSMIGAKLGINEKIYARKCTPMSIPHKRASEFMKENHIQGSVTGKINVGLFLEGRLISVMILSKPRYGKADYELLRFASLRGCNVIGGFNKLLAYSKIAGSVISYSSNSYSLGDVYGKTGWSLRSINAPGYQYTNDYQVLHHRSKFQKHKLKDLLEHFDPGKTEWENMQMNGYDRVWDAGTMTWTLERCDK